LPGQLAVCVFSPRLDERGNSVRGVKVCGALAEDLHLHSLRVARSARSPIRASYHVAAVPSRRRRPAAQVDALARVGARAVVYELQGDLLFAGAERVVHTIVERADELDMAVLDLRAVDRIEAPATRMLLSLRLELLTDGKEVAFVTTGGRAGLAAAAGLDVDAGLPMFSELDEARQWCEDRLLAQLGLSHEGLADVMLAGHRLCRGLDEAAVAELGGLLTERRVAAGQSIVGTGAAAEAIFLVLAGEVGVYVALADGARLRLASLPPGSTFGELAVLGESVRTADVVAERETLLMVLDASTFERLVDTNPRLKSRLLQNMLRGSHEIIARMNREVAALSRHH